MQECVLMNDRKIKKSWAKNIPLKWSTNEICGSQVFENIFLKAFNWTHSLYDKKSSKSVYTSRTGFKFTGTVGGG